MDVALKDKGVYAFGGFRLDPVRRMLWHGEERIKLTPRLFDTLVFFVENPGRLLDKDELLQAVWGGRIVEEGNLSQTISTLRKVLQGEGEAMIVTAPGRGYRFVAQVELTSGAPNYAIGEGLLPSDMHIEPAQPSGIAGKIWLFSNDSRIIGFFLASFAVLALAAVFSLMHWVDLRGSGPMAGKITLPAFTPPPHSVAVLALTNLTGDPNKDYVADGVADQFIAMLAQADDVQVAARTSSFSFRDSQTTLTQIARTLNVGAVLEGSVRRDGAGLRVSMQLVNGVSGYPFWSHSFLLGQDGSTAAQQQITDEVIGSLKLALLEGENNRLGLGGTRDPRAFDAYLRGFVANQKVNAASFKAAIADFSAAIAIDPNYAQAYAQRAYAQNFLVSTGAFSDSVIVKKIVDAGLADADRAVALAPGLGDAHLERARLLLTRLDFGGGKEEAERAIALAPGDAGIEQSYGLMEAQLGDQARSIAALRRAVMLDPLSAYAYADLATGLYWHHHFDEALHEIRHMAEVQPGMSVPMEDLEGMIANLQGHPAAALAACGGEHDWYQHECLAIADHSLRRDADAAKQFGKLRADMGETAAFNYAEVYAQWGDHAQALSWLHKAVELRDPGLGELRVDPLLDPLRGDQEFKEIEKRLNFPA